MPTSSMERGIPPKPARSMGRGAIAAMLAMALFAWTTALAPTRAASGPSPDATDAAAAGASEPPHIPNMIRFGPEQGLSRSVNDLAIDRQGYVWIATVDGLARYDGEGFKHWRYDPKRKDSLPANNVMAIFADSEDRIWAATMDELSFLDKDRGKFHRYRFDKKSSSCAVGISTFGGSHDGAIWIGTIDGDLCRVDPHGGSVRVSLQNAVDTQKKTIIPFAIHTSLSGEVWVGTTDGLLRVKNGKIERYAESIIGREEITAISPEKHFFWVGSEKNLYRVSEQEGRIEKIPGFPGGAIVAPGKHGDYWVGTIRGLYKNQLRDRKIYADRPSQRKEKPKTSVIWNDQIPIDSASVYTMRADKDGGLWVVGDVQGLSYLPPENVRFISVKAFKSFDAKKHDVVAIAGDEQKRLWMLTASALYLFSADGYNPLLVKEIDNNKTGNPKAIEACGGVVWISDDEGMFSLSADTKKTERLLKNRQDEVFESPYRIRCSKDRQLWVSLLGGDLELYSRNGELAYKRSASQIFGHATPGVVELNFDRNGAPWYTDDHDLFQSTAGGFKKVPLPPGRQVSAFEFQTKNILWVSRQGALERYFWDGRELKILQYVKEEQGMPMADIEGMAISSSGNIWMTTVRGLVLYDPKQNRARLFGIHDGLPGTDFYYGPPVMLGPNRAVALCADGLVFFDPERGLEPAKPSLLSVESLTLRRGGVEVALDPSRPVRMLAGDRDLRVVPRLLSFSNPLSHRYRSRLHGEDSEWVSQQGPSERVFSRLPAGRYTLELQAANADGAWSAPVSLSIEVMPPWWRTAWALVAYALLASAFLWWLSYLDRLRLKRRHSYQLAKQKREWAERASEAKSRFLADLGHELRTPMTGVLGMSELLIASGLEPRQHGQAQSIRRAGEHLLRLVDDALDLARVEAGRLELQHVEFGLDALIDEIAGLMSPLAARKGLRFVVERADGTPDRWLGDPLRLKQIVLNLLGNAIKFTERGRVGVRIGAMASMPVSDPSGDSDEAPVGLRIEVWDTGPGMNEEQVSRLFRRFEQAEGARTTARYGGTGLGLAISRELAIAMDGDIDVRSALGEGTTFVLTLPLVPRGAGDDNTATPTPLRSSSIAPDAARWCVVLLVEDDPTVAEVLTGLLQRQGHRVVHAAHGLAAMTEATVGRFDAAFVDLDLPGIDGCALAEQLRANGFSAPTIAITARADAQAESQAKAAGFVEFLRKPTTGERLEGALRRALARMIEEETSLDSAGAERAPRRHEDIRAGY